jgi:hypothetical protein
MDRNILDASARDMSMVFNPDFRKISLNNTMEI